MKTQHLYSKFAALAAATIILGATPAFARDGPPTRSGDARAQSSALSRAGFFRYAHFGDSGEGHGGRGGGWNNGGGNGHGGHGNGHGWGHGHNHGGGHGGNHGGGHGHGHGGGWWHGGGHPCSSG
ncbi:MAG TPA: hypothetical protein VM657_06525 [Sphingomonas sp.]|nr:hypothetical protein [Sphingomonas sp.]